MYNTFKGGYILCMTSIQVTLLFDHFQCHCTIIRQRFFWKMWNCSVAWNIETTIHRNENMTMNLQYSTNEWTLSSHFVYVAYIDAFSPAFQWYDKVVRQRRSRATFCNSFITTVWWYILYQKGYFLQFQKKKYTLDNNYYLARFF
jgi:hypothetical protein